MKEPMPIPISESTTLEMSATSSTQTGEAPGPTGEPGKDGYECLDQFPLTGPFWTQRPKHGQA
jgi:hypothetical protein